MSGEISAKISKTFGKKLRIRICGILIESGRILLVRHEGLGKNGFLWSPPGGEPHFGESIHKALKREFFEETGLLVEQKELLFINEFIESPLHAIELFFRVEKKGGSLMKGEEPEFSGENFISDVSFMSIEDIRKTGPENVHRLFREIDSIDQIHNISGVLTQYN